MMLFYPCCCIDLLDRKDWYWEWYFNRL